MKSFLGIKPKLVVVLVLAVGMLLMGAVYIEAVRSLLVSDQERALTSIASQAASALEASLNGQVEALEAIAGLESIADPEASLESKLAILKSESERRGFIRLSIADPMGKAHGSDGQTLDVSDREHFKRALEGEPFLSGRLEAMTGQGAIVVQAVPVYYAGEIVSVLMATEQVDTVSTLLDGLTFLRDESACVIMDDGSLVAVDGTSPFITSENFYDKLAASTDADDLASLRTSIAGGVPGAGSYVLDGEARFAGYARVPGTDGWHIVVSSESDVVMAQANRIILMSLSLLAAIALLVGMITVYTLALRRRYSASERMHLREVQELAYKDQLTGLPNRISMAREMLNYFAVCRRDRMTGAAFLIDIDDFHLINNTFGHALGDRMIAEVGQRLRTLQDAATGRVIAGRFGGDDFIVVNIGVKDRDDVNAFIKRINALFEAPLAIAEGGLRLTVSIGVVMYNEFHDCPMIDIEEMVRHCELALAQAHKMESQNFFVFDEALGRIYDDELHMQYELRGALERHEFTLHYQPQFDLHEDRIVGFEALLRWNSPRYGTVSPAIFIPMAERGGFIVDIGRFVIDRAFAFAKSVEGSGMEVSANCSAIEILQNDFVDYVADRFDAYRLKPGDVAIEITESSLIGSFDRVVDKLEQLRSRGIAVHLDDFGTGFSSLTYLKDLPLDVVKIDRSFTVGLETETINRDIVTAIVILCNHLGLQSLAEGVETEAQLRVLRECGCDKVQGYLVSMPLPQHEARLLAVGPAIGGDVDSEN